MFEETLLQKISELTGKLVQHNLKKFERSKGDPNEFTDAEGTLETGGDDSFYDYMPNGLHVLSAVFYILQYFYGDEAPDLEGAKEIKTYISEVYHQDVTIGQAKIFDKLFELVGIKSDLGEEEEED